MSLASTHHELDSLGNGRYRHTQLQQVLPVFAANDVTDCTTRDAKLGSEVILRYLSWAIERANVRNLRICQLGIAIKHANTIVAAVSHDTIAHVISLRASIQVFRIAAAAVITLMTNQLPVRNRAVCKFVGNTMSILISPIQKDRAVPILKHGTMPLHAAIIGVRNRLLPEGCGPGMVSRVSFDIVQWLAFLPTVAGIGTLANLGSLTTSALTETIRYVAHIVLPPSEDYIIHVGICQWR